MAPRFNFASNNSPDSILSQKWVDLAASTVISLRERLLVFQWRVFSFKFVSHSLFSYLQTRLVNVIKLLTVLFFTGTVI